MSRGEPKGLDGGDRKTKTNHDYERDWKKLQESAPLKGIAAYKQDSFLDAMEDMIQVGYHPSRFDKFRQAVSDQMLKNLPPERHWNHDRCFASKYAVI